MKNNIGLLLAKRAECNTELESLVEVASGRRFTFAALNERANRVAHIAESHGIGRGERVAILLMNGTEFVEVFFGLAKCGVILVPLNWRLVPDELSYILKDSGARVLIYGEEFAEQVGELKRRGADGTNVDLWIEVGDAARRQPFAESYDQALAAASPAEPEAVADEDDVLFIMYTSGTTGLPKGSVHSHGTFFWAILSMAASAELRFQDRYAIILPSFHVGALLPVICNVYRGVTNVVLREFDPKVMWEVIEHERITVTLAVPSMLNFMLQVPGFERYDHSSLRWVISGATPVPVSLIERYAELGIEVHQAYGLTESGGPGCIISPDQALEHIGSTGKAFFHADVRIVDADGNDTPPGVPGEVIIRAPHVMLGYWNNPEATAETIRDGWLYTGDIAFADEAGFVTIHDRVKDMVISGGENIYPAELEDVIMRHEAVAEVAVIGQPSERWGESPFAVVVPRAGSELSEHEVLAHCGRSLARFKLPKGVAFVDQIPRNPTGKALKRILREQFPGPARE